MNTKTCSACGQPKPLLDFHKNSRSKDGLCSACKKCACAKTAAWRKANPKRQEKNERNAYLRNKDRYIERAIAWERNHPERRKAICAKWSKNNRSKKAAGARKRWHEHPERHRQYARRAAAKRRTREWSNDQGNVIPMRWWNAIFAIIETQVCMYCGNAPVDLTMDHFIPVSKGGRTEIGNLLPCCRPCNSRKSNHDPERWARENCGPGAYEQFLLFLNATKEAYLEEQAEQPSL